MYSDVSVVGSKSVFQLCMGIDYKLYNRIGNVCTVAFLYTYPCDTWPPLCSNQGVHVLFFFFKLPVDKSTMCLSALDMT